MYVTYFYAYALNNVPNLEHRIPCNLLGLLAQIAHNSGSIPQVRIS